MIIKTHYQSKLSQIKEILEPYGFYKDSFDDIKELEAIIDDYAFRVVMIGGFSSGKSALLNRLAGRKVFKEDQGPETAVPAEISWAPIDSAAVVFEDGRVENHPLDGVTENPPHKALFLSLNVNIPFLKARPELVLVDFPGFDSNIEAHNKAITNYIQRGSAFILLIPARSGGLTESDRKFVKEVAHYPQGLACFISKSDLVPEEQCQDVVAHVQRGIRTIYGTDVSVETISIMEDVEPRFEEKIAEVVDRFQPQVLFDTSLSAPINAVLSKAIMALTQYMEATQLDVQDIEDRIAESESRRVELGRQLENERKALDHKYEYEIIPGILDKLENALHNNIDTLADALVAGQQRFADSVQSIVRPILSAVPGQIQANLRDAVGGIRLNFSQQDPEREENFKNALLNIVDVVSSLPMLGGGSANPKTSTQTSSGSATGSMLSGLGTGLVVGSLVNPILGIAVALAPALINLFFSAKNSSQPNIHDQARAQVESQAIPAVIARLESQVAPAVLETRDMMLAEIKARIDESFATETAALESAKKEKDERTAEHKKNTDRMQQDLIALQDLFIDGV